MANPFLIQGHNYIMLLACLYMHYIGQNKYPSIQKRVWHCPSKQRFVIIECTGQKGARTPLYPSTPLCSYNEWAPVLWPRHHIWWQCTPESHIIPSWGLTMLPASDMKMLFASFGFDLRHLDKGKHLYSLWICSLFVQFYPHSHMTFSQWARKNEGYGIMK